MPTLGVLVTPNYLTSTPNCTSSLWMFILRKRSLKSLFI